jgi:hypothetical protein
VITTLYETPSPAFFIVDLPQVLKGGRNYVRMHMMASATKTLRRPLT